jgi:hypothetical protein
MGSAGGGTHHYVEEKERGPTFWFIYGFILGSLLTWLMI